MIANGLPVMEFTRCYLPLEWEERWRREKERRKRVIEEGGEGIERDEQELRRIVAYNDSRMGLSSVRNDKEESKVSISGGVQEEHTGATFDKYCIKTFPDDIFRTLKEFREAGVLTDLTLILESGHSYQVHSPVFAAISTFVYNRLGEKSGDNIFRYSLNLGPEVNNTGLKAVLEFAYTGAILSLNEDTLGSVIAAAQAMEVSRVLDICGKDDKTKKSGRSDEDGGNSSAQGQLKTNLESIERLCAERVGCDVELDVDGVVFHVHKVILAVSSDYFRGMFTCGMKESNQTCIALPFLLASELEVLIACSYCGYLQLNWDCIFEIACTALQLQFMPAFSLCFNFMQQKMDTRSCLDVVSFAEAYEMSELLDEANDFVLRNFWEVSGTAMFLDLPAEKLLDFLRCDGLCAPSELAVFRAVASWIEANPEERLGQASFLMTGVRFPLMTFREFREVRAINLRMECFGNKDVELYGTALKEFCFGIPQTQDQCRVRRPKDALVLVGGDKLNSDIGQRIASREVWFANCLRSGTGLVKEIEWRRLGDLPDQPKFRHGVAAIGRRLYAVGGCYFYTANDIMKSAYSYDPGENSWKRLEDMNEFRSNFSLLVNEDRLYAIGGDRESNTNVDTVEVYNPGTDSWSFVHPLDQALSGQAAAVSDGGIFISGGFNCKYECRVSTFLYHPERGTTYLADMGCDRAQHCMEALRGCLYVVGGVCNLRKFYMDQQVCEVYTPGTDCWSVFVPLPVPHVGAASAVLEDKLYILGGYCQEDYSESGLVHRFEPSKNRWENMGRLPGAVTDVRACLIRLPNNLRP